VQIVADDPASQRVLRVMLEADGFRVVTSDTCMAGNNLSIDLGRRIGASATGTGWS
jgi:hypothetical protein